MNKLIRIGTRGSELAMWQAKFIEKQLQDYGFETKIIKIETKGDKILDTSISKIGSKGVFTEEIENQLLAGELDIAVHSAKDLPSDLGENFELISLSKREKVNDVLVSTDGSLNLNTGETFVVGTSSTRRIAQLRAYAPHIKIIDMRGNLQTRIAKMQSGVCDALILARAGMIRLKKEVLIVQELDLKIYTTPAGQGSIAIESLKNIDPELRAVIRNACNDENTEQCIKAERAFLNDINGGCSIPVFAYAEKINDLIYLSAGLFSLDGQIRLKTQQSGKDYETLGKLASKDLKDHGAEQLLSSIKENL